MLNAAGAGADTVSGGEIRRALRAGIAPEKIIFSGLGKTREEIAFALESGIGQLNVESTEELEIIDRIAAGRSIKARVSVRVNPDVDAGTHDKISTGRKADKFGIPWTSLGRLSKGPDLVASEGGRGGVPYWQPDHRFQTIQRRVCESYEPGPGVTSRRFCFEAHRPRRRTGITYKDENPIGISDYAAFVMNHVRPLDLQLFLEPGRSISAPAGALISEVQFIKQTEGNSFVVLDAGMNDLARPAIYGAYHEIVPVRQRDGEESDDFVGPVCESSDIFGSNRRVSKLESGDLVAILNAGAYGAAMSSNYNTRPLPPEVLVDDHQFKTIRERQSFEEIVALERY